MLYKIAQPVGPSARKNLVVRFNAFQIHDVLKHIYTTEQQFVPRDKRESLLVGAERGNALAEAVFGVYPTSSDVKYIEKGYVDVYRPGKVKANPETWRRAYLRGAETPLRITRYGLDQQRYWHHDLLIYVFDPPASDGSHRSLESEARTASRAADPHWMVRSLS